MLPGPPGTEVGARDMSASGLPDMEYSSGLSKLPVEGIRCGLSGLELALATLPFLEC